MFSRWRTTASCMHVSTLAIMSTAGNESKIMSPDSRIIYSLRSEQRETERIPFSAITEADAKTLYWFVDESFVGSTPRAEVLFWQSVVGELEIRVVDDHGRAAATQIRVQLVN